MNLEDPIPTPVPISDDEVRSRATTFVLMSLAAWAVFSDAFRGNFARNVIWATAYVGWMFALSITAFRYYPLFGADRRNVDVCVEYVGCPCTTHMETCNPYTMFSIMSCSFAVWVSPLFAMWCAGYSLRRYFPDAHPKYPDAAPLVRTILWAFGPFVVIGGLALGCVGAMMGMFAWSHFNTVWDFVYVGDANTPPCGSEGRS